MCGTKHVLWCAYTNIKLSRLWKTALNLFFYNVERIKLRAITILIVYAFLKLLYIWEKTWQK